jgi:signal transduction histidine kinase
MIDIKDRGIGISPEDIQKIFQPFFRVDESRHTEGFGLGLALAHRIIKLHKGSLGVISEPDLGSTFTITLPIARSNP